MNARAVFRYLALSLGFIGLGAAIPLMVAVFSGEMAEALGFGTGVFLSIVFLILILVMVPAADQRTSNRDVLVILIAWWFLAPIVALPGFLIGIPETGLLDAYFEAVSCLTTTGTSRFAGSFISGETPSASLLAWRGVLHFQGAVAMLASALTILPALNFGGTGMHRTRLFAGSEQSMLAAMRRALGVSALVLGLLFIAALFLLALAGVTPVRAMTLSLSAVTTGLVDPVGDLRAPPTGPANLIVALTLLASSVSVMTLIGIRAWPARLWRDTEALALIVLVPVIAFAVAWLAGLAPGGATLVWAASHAATSGIMTEPLSTGLGETSYLLVILMSLVGGAALSTAGGIKIARVLILAERSRLEFSRLGYQNAVAPFIFRGRLKDDNVIVGVWVYLIAYLLAALATALVLSLSGRDFTQALLMGVGAVSNAGHLLPVAMRDGEAFAAAIAMILGRIEVLALLPLLRPGFWRD